MATAASHGASPALNHKKYWKDIRGPCDVVLHIAFQEKETSFHNKLVFVDMSSAINYIEHTSV